MTTHKMWATDKKGSVWLFECPECGHVVEVDFSNGHHKEIVPSPNMYDKHVGMTGEMEIRESE